MNLSLMKSCVERTAGVLAIPVLTYVDCQASPTTTPRRVVEGEVVAVIVLALAPRAASGTSARGPRCTRRRAATGPGHGCRYSYDAAGTLESPMLSRQSRPTLSTGADISD